MLSSVSNGLSATISAARSANGRLVRCDTCRMGRRTQILFSTANRIDKRRSSSQGQTSDAARRARVVWAIKEMGIRAIIGSSFGDIFHANCFQNGLLPIVIDKSEVEQIVSEIEATQGSGHVGIDLETETISMPSGRKIAFKIDPRRRAALLEGLDEIGLTLKRDADIRAFQVADRAKRPWIYMQGKTW